MCVHARALAHVGECLCVHKCVCVGACTGTGTGVCLRACSLTNPACIAQPHCYLRPLWVHHIFRNYLINGTIFGKKLWNVKCVFWFSVQVLIETFLILTRIQRDIFINLKTSWCKVTWCKETWILSTDFRLDLKISSFIKIRPEGIELFHAERETDRRTNMTKLAI